MKRLARYLAGNGRMISKYEWQGHESEIVGYSDSDWAGCRVTGKSTSGGAIMCGSHYLKGWARIQNHVTLSSAEAELIALVKCTSELLGIRAMYRDWGSIKTGIVYADSSSALAIAKRKGAGKLRHIHISALWIQEKQDREDTTYAKILGSDSLADLMTKTLVREKIDKYLALLHQVRMEGRADSGLELQDAKQQ